MNRRIRRAIPWFILGTIFCVASFCAGAINPLAGLGSGGSRGPVIAPGGTGGIFGLDNYNYSDPGGNWDDGSNSGSWNWGGDNSGSWNDGGDNSGSWNFGGDNSGSWDSGGWDSGSNSGSWDWGGSNGGSWNSGGSDSGGWDSGGWNSGGSNSGSW